MHIFPHHGVDFISPINVWMIGLSRSLYFLVEWVNFTAHIGGASMYKRSKLCYSMELQRQNIADFLKSYLARYFY